MAYRTAYIKVTHPADASKWKMISVGQLYNEGTELTPATTTTAPTSPPSGGGGSGCHLAGTMIEMADGTFKAIENIEVGDSVRSASYSGLSQEENAWTTWSIPIEQFGTNTSTATVLSINERQFNAYRNINNGLLKLTYEHPLLSQKDGVVAYRQVQHLAVGDSLWYKNTNGVMEWLEITSIEFEQLENQAIFSTWTIDVENEDGYFANGVAAHNAEQELLEDKTDDPLSDVPAE